MSWLLRATHLSWRKDYAELAQLDRVLSSERTLVVFWHGKYFPLFSLLWGRSACIFTSLNFRGRVIAEISRRFGYDCVLLPDSGGQQSLTLLREALGLHRTGAIAIDGPLGPYHVVKRGVLELASELGYVLQPVSAASNWKRVVHKRWDRAEIPRPFSRVTVTVGEPIRVSPSISAKGLSATKNQVRRALEVLDLRAEERALSRR